MYVKNFFNPGDYVQPHPFGIPLTLEYDATGNLHKVFLGMKHDIKPCFAVPEIRENLLKLYQIPATISLKHGTTWVRGVLYTQKIPYGLGLIRQFAIHTLMEEYKFNPSDFVFYASTVESLAMNYKGAASIRQWLALNKFKPLPGWVISVQATDDSFRKLVVDSKTGFQPEFLTGFTIFRDAKVEYVTLDSIQIKCKSVTQVTDVNGFIYGDVSYEDGGNSVSIIRLPISDICRYNIQKNSLIVLDECGTILKSYFPQGKHTAQREFSNAITCQSCGRIIRVPITGSCKCSNSHCKSVLYPRLQHFCDVLHLPELNYNIYQAYVASNKLTCIFDVLELDEYKDLDIRANISQLIHALVPATVENDATIFERIVNNCNNSAESVMYYIKHPDKITIDLQIPADKCQGLIDWFEDSENILELYTLLHSKNITIDNTCRSFDGPPIFRDKIISLTGTFRHGTYEQIAAIFQSYGASVEPYSQHVHCMVIGDIPENINGHNVNECKQNNIPVFSESEFFEMYEIEDDLVKNLF